MSCQECELKLGMGEDAGEHLALCSECRGVARELRLNAVALGDLRRRPFGYWAVAGAAAAVLVAVGVWVKPEAPVIMAAHGAAPLLRQQKHVDTNVDAGRLEARATRPKTRRARKAEEPLRVKMFTSDPDVVIYWIVDTKEGVE